MIKAEKVKEIMTRDSITCNPETTLAEVVEQLTLAEINALIVVDKKSGELKGVVSQFDLLKHYSEDLNTQNVGKIMSTQLQTINGDAAIEDAARQMVENEVHRLVVIEEGDNKPVGVISASDIIQAMAED